ncbi:regulator, partial [Salmonella enterica subsp. enterica serovar Derby]|nr:regulator [Salmonella enterica subsp. enterica serovar Derby]EIT9230972.1 regulator [Salmonella enterica subsp. enterica serovar Derby]
MKVIINTDKAPSAIGPYSQGFIFNGLVFTSGQLPLYPKTMNLTEGGIKEQTWQALLNLKFVLEMGGASLETVLKTTCFLKNMDDFNAFNEVYETFFG